MKQVLGVTFNEKEGQQTVGVYVDENGAECFVTDEPYLLSDGTSLTEPLPIMIVDGPYDTNAQTLQAPMPLAFKAQEYIDDLGIPEFNVGGNYNDGIYWKPSNPADPTSPPVFTTAADHFSAFQRAGTKWEPNAQGIYVPYANNVPAFRWENGRRKLSLEGAATNKVTCRKNNPIDLSNTTKSGAVEAVASIVNDAAALASAGLADLCTNSMVYKLDNSSGSVNAYLTFSGSAGNTNPHMGRAFWRVEGTGRSRLQATGGGASGSTDYVNPGGGYAPRSFAFTVVAPSSRIELVAEPGAIGYIILPELVEGTFLGSIIPGDTLAAVTRPADNFRLSPAHEAVLQQSAATALVRGGNVKNLAAARVIGGGVARLIGGAALGTAMQVGDSASISIATGLSAPIPEIGVAASWDASGKAGSYNGASTVSDGVALDTTLTEIYLGRSSSGNIMNFSADLCVAAPARLSNARLQELAVAA